jgi:lactate permease
MDPAPVPTDLWHWLLAASTIVVLLALLGARRWTAAQAGPVGLAVAAAVALAAFRTPVETVVVAAGKGVWDAVFILFVIWPALLLYRVIDNAGGFEALRKGVVHFSTDELFLVMSFGWVFASFLQGITGFGTPIAVVAPLLVAFGVRPVHAVVIPLIGHAWANLFGTLAVAWLGTRQVVDLDDDGTTAVESALLLWPPNAIAGVAIAWLLGRGPALRHLWPMIAIVTAVHGGGQLLLVHWDPILSNFLATTLALLALVPLARWERFSHDPEQVDERPAFDRERERTEDEAEPTSVMGLGMAVAPYVVLTGLAVAVVAIGPVDRFLGALELGVAFGATDTGYDVVNESADAYNAFAPLTHPGTFLLGASAVAWVLYRARGRYQAWRELTATLADEPQPAPIGAGVVSDAVPASLAIVTFLALSRVMDHSGQTQTLAIGLSDVSPAPVYAFFASWVGMLGAFMTSSNTSSNVIFGPLQDTVAATEGLQQSTVIAAQHAGGAVGNSIAPANVVLGTGAAGVVGQEGAVLRLVLPYAAASLIAIGAGTLLLGP